MEMHPIKLHGNWDEGWALDQHTLSSEYLGDSPLGRPQFRTVRSEIGEAMYPLKYRGFVGIVPKIAELATELLKEKGLLSSINIVLPVPPTTQREFQPVFMIAEDLATLNDLFYSSEALVKTSTEAAKNMDSVQKMKLPSTIQFVRSFNRPCNVLVIDDIFDTGGTLTGCVRALRRDPNTQRVFVLTMTKKRT